MAVAYLDSVKTLFVATTTSYVVTGPSTLATGDLLWVQLNYNSSTATATPPAGWTAGLAATFSGSAAVCCYYHVVTSGEAASPPASYTFTMSASVIGNALLARFSGVDVGTPINAGPATVANGVAAKTVASITTTVADAFVFGGLVVQSASSIAAQLPASGWTQIATSNGDGAGRAGIIGHKGAQAVAGATGTAAFTAASAIGGVAYQLALTPSAGASGENVSIPLAFGLSTAATVAALPTVTARWVGETTTSGLTVSVCTTGGASVRVKLSTASDLSASPAFSTPVAPSAGGWTKHTFSGLSADTTYYYAAEIDSVIDSGNIKSTSTFPTTNFVACFASCLNSGSSGRAVFDVVLAQNPDLFIHTGDFHYADLMTNDVPAYRSAMLGQITGNPGLRDMLAAVPTAYFCSDHDSGNNDWSPGPGTQTPAFLSVYGEMVPHYSRPAGDGIYQTWVVGRVRFIGLDSRSYRSANSATDNSSKTMFGATQKAWLFARLSDPEPVKVMVMDVPWIETPTAGSDKWGGFATERAEIANYVTSNGISAVIIHGDMHALAADDGTNSAGGIPVLAAAPLTQSSSIKGGPYSQGTYPPSGSTGLTERQFGKMTFTDSGSAITIDYAGIDSTGVTRITMSTTFSTTPAGRASGRLVQATAGAVDAAAAAYRQSSRPVIIRGARDAAAGTGGDVAIAGSFTVAASATVGAAAAATVAGAFSLTAAATVARSAAATVTSTFGIAASATVGGMTAADASLSLLFGMAVGASVTSDAVTAPRVTAVSTRGTTITARP